MEKSDFDTYYIERQSLNSPEKPARNHNICEPAENINSLPDMLVLH